MRDIARRLLAHVEMKIEYRRTPLVRFLLKHERGYESGTGNRTKKLTTSD
jgi:hypothetical protein